MKKLFLVFLLLQVGLFAQLNNTNFNIMRGDATTLTFASKYNLTGDSLIFVVKASKDITAVRLIQKTSYDNQITISTGTKSFLYIKLLSDDTDDLTLAKYYYDITRIKDGDTTTIFIGELNLQPDIGTPFDGTDVTGRVTTVSLDNGTIQDEIIVWDTTLSKYKPAGKVLTDVQKDSIQAMIDATTRGIVYISNYGTDDNFNGVTNDSSVFMDAWNDVPEGGTLIINKMLYVGSSGWQGFLFEGVDNRIIKGESGGGFSLLYKPTQLSGTWWSHQPPLFRFDKCDNITIEGIHINGKGISADAIEFDSCSYYILRDCLLDSLGNFTIEEGSVNVVLTLGGYRGLIDNNIINEIPFSGIGIAVTTPTEKEITISNNKISKANQDAIFVTGAKGGGCFNNIMSDAGLILASSDHPTEGSLIDGFQVIGNTFANSWGSAIKTDGANSWVQSRNSVTISHNTFIADSTVAINVTYINGWNISDNIIINPGGSSKNIGEKRCGIGYSNAINTNISNNLIIDNRPTKEMEIGIYVAPYDTLMTNNRINNNTIIGASEYGIYVTKGYSDGLEDFVSKDNYMQGNYVDSCGIYGIFLNSGMEFQFDDNIMRNNGTDLRLDTTQVGTNNVYSTFISYNGSKIRTLYDSLFTTAEIRSLNTPIATNGFLRLSEEDSIMFRNHDNNNNIVGIYKDTTDKVFVGGAEGISISNIEVTQLPSDTTGLKGGAIVVNPKTGLLSQILPANLLVNGGFTDWTGVYKKDYPTNFITNVGLIDTTKAWFENSDGALRIINDGSVEQLGIYQIGDVTVGEKYGYSFDVISWTGDSTNIIICGFSANGFLPLSAGHYSGEETATYAGLLAIYTYAKTTDIVLDNFKIWKVFGGEPTAPEIDVSNISAGIDSFATSATVDTITNAEIHSTDIFTVSIRDITPVADDLLSWYAEEGRLLVFRIAGTTSNLNYSYQRIK